ncbi:SMP-30/gluconolactonase/LRE family protein [Polynucleobacter sp. Latsch14-2]|jgi:gluconolactonase|uniref:SMP-30/gluconolactonase/LRE family protein n=1 Tax=Polynucleobacter sp. Latsch14-2 TaxID=2576920 RepID=UPI001C0CA47D|nr:SMP-30/gluconolactonase/LRE family protein [Polynucleobacter sp. Latsch14-2]MBU3614199.1 SMP-30/gluconolactonase/LRE family protein [Polynucleobacter sp. Latsch14-2]
MFNAPPVLGTEVFARIPDQYRKAGQLSNERLQAGKGTLKTDSYIEGPSFDREGNLYIVDIAFGLIYQISPQGVVKLVAEYDGEPNGLKIHQDGRIFIADHKNGLMLLDQPQGVVKPFIERYKTESFKGLNDLVFSKNGNLYFTDQGQTGLQDPSGRVFCLNKAGDLACLLNNVPSPNGIALNPQESVLYIAATRANSVWRAMLLPDGSITRVGNFIQMSGGSGPDGLALDQTGNIYVAHAGFGAVWKFSPQGEPLLRINSCTGLMTTNIAFGGKDRQDLYITESESGSILVARMDTPGLPLYSHE